MAGAGNARDSRWSAGHSHLKVAARSRKCHLRGHDRQATMRPPNFSRPSRSGRRCIRSTAPPLWAPAKSREPMDATADPPRRSFAFGLERAGLLSLDWPRLASFAILLASVLAAFGLAR